MSMPEEAGKAVSSVVDGLKGNPSCLAAIVLAALFAVLTFYAMQKDAERKAKTVDILLQHCIYPGADKPARNYEGVGP